MHHRRTDSASQRSPRNEPARRHDPRPLGGARGWFACVVIAVAVAAVLLAFAPAAFAAGNDVGLNLGSLLRQYAGELYAGVVAIVSLVFLINRRYTELGIFLVAAVVVGWMVFSPDQVAQTARAIGKQILP